MSISQEQARELFGLSASCNDQDVRRAFHKLCLQHHPDKNPSPAAAEMFDRIKKSADVLLGATVVRDVIRSFENFLQEQATRQQSRVQCIQQQYQAEGVANEALANRYLSLMQEQSKAFDEVCASRKKQKPNPDSVQPLYKSLAPMFTFLLEQASEHRSSIRLLLQELKVEEGEGSVDCAFEAINLSFVERLCLACNQVPVDDDIQAFLKEVMHQCTRCRTFTGCKAITDIHVHCTCPMKATQRSRTTTGARPGTQLYALGQIINSFHKTVDDIPTPWQVSDVYEFLDRDGKLYLLPKGQVPPEGLQEDVFVTEHSTRSQIYDRIRTLLSREGPKIHVYRLNTKKSLGVWFYQDKKQNPC